MTFVAHRVDRFTRRSRPAHDRRRRTLYQASMCLPSFVSTSLRHVYPLRLHYQCRVSRVCRCSDGTLLETCSSNRKPERDWTMILNRVPSAMNAICTVEPNEMQPPSRAGAMIIVKLCCFERQTFEMLLQGSNRVSATQHSPNFTVERSTD